MSDGGKERQGSGIGEGSREQIGTGIGKGIGKGIWGRKHVVNWKEEKKRCQKREKGTNRR